MLESHCRPFLPLVLARSFVEDVFLAIDSEHTILECALPIIRGQELMF